MLICPVCQMYWSDYSDVACCDCGYPIDEMWPVAGTEHDPESDLAKLKASVDDVNAGRVRDINETIREAADAE